MRNNPTLLRRIVTSKSGVTLIEMLMIFIMLAPVAGYVYYRNSKSIHTSKVVIQPVQEFDVTGVKFTGLGLDDLSRQGTFSGGTDNFWRVIIDGTGTPDTFSWLDNSGGSSGVEMTGDWQELSDGFQIKFDATTGHTLGDIWAWLVGSVPMQVSSYNQSPVLTSSVYSGMHCFGLLDSVDNLYFAGLGSWVLIGNEGAINILQGTDIRSYSNLCLGDWGAGDGGGTNTLAFQSGAAPTTSPADSVQLYAKEWGDRAVVELFVKDEATNDTPLGPHDPETGEWIFYSKNLKTGKVLKVNMEKFVKAAEKLTGESFMTESYEELGK